MAIKKNPQTGLWDFNAYIGTTPAGKRVYKTRRGFESKREAQNSLAEMKLKFDAGKLRDTDPVYKDAYLTWLKDYKPTVKVSTYKKTVEKYEKHILPAFGHLKMSQITPALCHDFYRTIAQKMVRYQEVYWYAKNLYDIYNKDDVTPFDGPPKIISTYKSREKKYEFLSVEESKHMLDCFYHRYKLNKDINRFKQYVFFTLLSHTALRSGEAGALLWDDITPESIKVSKTLIRALNGDIIAGTPKTKASVGVVPITETLFLLLMEWKKLQQVRYPDETVVFNGRFGGYMSPESPHQWLSKVIKEYGLRPFTVHTIRHSVATQLLASGASIIDVMHVLRHSDYTTTYNFYIGVDEARKKDVIKNYHEYISSKISSRETLTPIEVDDINKERK